MRDKRAGKFKDRVTRILTVPSSKAPSVDDLEAIFLNDRIGEDFLGNFLELLLGLVAGPAVEIENEEFALANVGDGAIAKTGEGVVDCLTLGIENGALWHHPNVSFHKKSIAGGARELREVGNPPRVRVRFRAKFKSYLRSVAGARVTHPISRKSGKYGTYFFKNEKSERVRKSNGWIQGE